jgi:hypothetical protein
MSLINEALKKAQKQRTGESTPLPAIGGESAERIARRSKSSGLNTLLLRLGIGGVVVTGVIVAGVFLLRKPASVPVAATAPAPILATTSTPVAAAPTPKPAEPVPVPVAPAPAVASPSTATPTPAPAFVVTTAAAPAPPVIPKSEAPAPIVLPVPAASTPVVAAEVPAPPKPEPAKSAVPGKLEPRAINFIESLHVAGIRASSSDAQVLMNDRVYRIGSVVEADMGLKLTGITTHSLTFEDEHGASYTRTF